jgi:glyoxylase I family protein
MCPSTAEAGCDRAVQWWQDVLGFLLVHQVHEDNYEARAMIHPSGIAVTVMTHDATAASGQFDERRVGLDHLAFRVIDRDELHRWTTHFDKMGVTNTGIIDTDTRLVESASGVAQPAALKCSSRNRYQR